ncbi:MAG: carbohydrate kinase [Desulfobacterales bacterium]|jgi:fructokinase|nr:carbohydrate kinase [Desulfobacterales bacterium]
MIISIGEILVDVFPDYQRIGGAPFNFAYHLKQFEFPVRFFSRIGKDAFGREIRALASASGLNPEDLQIDSQRPTGRVEVQLTDQGNPRFVIIENAAYDFFTLDKTITEVLHLPPRMIYFGSLMQRTRNGFDTLQRILSQKHPDTLCLYDMNLRPGCAQPHIIIKSLPHADILKLNEEELEITAAHLRLRHVNEPETVAALMARFNINIVAVTRGAAGSALYTETQRHEIAAPPAVAVADTVGAGDAYSAVLAAGVLSGWPPEKILIHANRFSAHICSVKGAFPAAGHMYAEFRAQFGETIR